MSSSKSVFCGKVKIGGGAPVSVQSMTNTDTRDVSATLDQIRRLADAGADIVRCTVPDTEAAAAQYQTDNGLAVTGLLTEELVQTMVANGQITDKRMMAGVDEAYESWLGYEQFAAAPSSYVTTKVRFTGTVIQIAAPTDGRNGCLRLAVDGDNKKVIFVTFKAGTLDGVEEGATVTILGRGAGAITYIAATGEEVTVPWLMADRTAE